jgi:catechol 2,3-dioxygenase-like lactoylglutathione lyase family enzyme
MINGIHGVIYTKDAEGLRAFFRDKLGFPSVDAGHGWLIFALPPGELGIHPITGRGYCELWLMCDDLNRTVKGLRAKGVDVSGAVSDEGFGPATLVKLPGGGEIGLFQPTHPTALHLAATGSEKTTIWKKRFSKKRGFRNKTLLSR